jgi:hypothetical protein
VNRIAVSADDFLLGFERANRVALVSPYSPPENNASDFAVSRRQLLANRVGLNEDQSYRWNRLLPGEVLP